MYKGKIIKIESNHDLVRSDEMEGYFPYLPRVGEAFHIIGEAFNELIREMGGSRLISTTPVQDVQVLSDTEIQFCTRNSVYKLVNIEEKEEGEK